MATQMLENGADIRYDPGDPRARAAHVTTEIYTQRDDRDVLAVHARTHPAEQAALRPRRSEDPGNDALLADLAADAAKDEIGPRT